MREFIRRLVIGITEISLLLLLILGGAFGYYIGASLTKNAQYDYISLWTPLACMMLGILVAALVNSLYYILLDIRANTKQTRDISRALLEIQRETRSASFQSHETTAQKVDNSVPKNSSSLTIQDRIRAMTEAWALNSFRSGFLPCTKEDRIRLAETFSEQLSQEMNTPIKVGVGQIERALYSIYDDKKITMRFNLLGGIESIRANQAK